MKRVILACLLLASPAMAQQPPEMVLLPRQLAESAVAWIATPNATDAVQLFVALNSCLANNPTGGVMRRAGPDRCPVVTEALAAKDEQITALTKERDDLKAKEKPEPSAPAKK